MNSSASRAQRDELADFLRTRRSRLTPSDVGLPQSQRRRTPGLRREEVAHLAGVSSTWYTRLEQGCDIHVSVDVLDSIAQALHLTTDEHEYLIYLAQHRPRPPTPAIEAIDPALQAVLDSLTACPAIVLGRRWDILAWNRTASTVYTDFGAIPLESRNYVYWVYTHPTARQLLINWETHAQLVLARFRTAYGRNIDDPRFAELINTLCAHSDTFKQWWARHEVKERGEWNKAVQHPIVGELQLEHIVLRMVSNLDIQVILQPPLSAETAQKLCWLANQDPGT
jgi:transcriptional regulator with XRE-family HTH domain